MFLFPIYISENCHNGFLENVAKNFYLQSVMEAVM